MKEGEKELSEAENLPENDDKRERKIADAEGKKHKAKLLIDLEQATKRQQARMVENLQRTHAAS